MIPALILIFIFSSLFDIALHSGFGALFFDSPFFFVFFFTFCPASTGILSLFFFLFIVLILLYSCLMISFFFFPHSL